jgi:hypothetical protein
MPKNPDKLRSKLRWWALGLIPLSASVVYFSANDKRQTPLKTITVAESPLVSQSPLNSESSFPAQQQENPEVLQAPELPVQIKSELKSQIRNKEMPAGSAESNRSEVVSVAPPAPSSTELVETKNPLSAPSLSDLLTRQANTPSSHVSNNSSGSPSSSPDHLSSKSQLEPVSLKKADSLDRVSIDRYKEPKQETFDVSFEEKQPRRSLLSQVSPVESANADSPSKTSGSNSNTSSVKKASNSSKGNASEENEDDAPPFPSAEEGKKRETGTQLKLAKPYCFLLPKGSPAAQCAMESVKLIVEEYAKADVHVIPVFRWWGDDYSDDPGTLEKQAIEACNLQAAFPWIEGGNKVASIQAFVRHPIPSIQCGKDPVKDPVSGCSNLCPNGSPSFSTVSEQECSAGTALHESGHSNCCASQCKNKGDCQPKPEIDAGCGLCLQGGGSQASLDRLKQLLASNSPKECNLTAAALESIRAGASQNPGYVYNPNKQYKPRGKKLDSIFGKKGVKKLLRGVGDKADGDGSGEGEGTPMSSDDGATTSRRTSSSTKKGTQETGDDKVVPQDNPKGYSQEQIDNFTKQND